MSIDDLEGVPVSGQNFLAPGDEGRVRTMGTPFQNGCIPDEYTLQVSSTPTAGDGMDLESTMGGGC